MYNPGNDKYEPVFAHLVCMSKDMFFQSVVVHIDISSYGDLCLDLFKHLNFFRLHQPPTLQDADD